MAPLGKFGEMVVTHGEAIDPTNSWGNQVDPFSVHADGKRIIEDNFGTQVVEREGRTAERKSPEADNNSGSALKTVAHDILTNRKMFRAATKMLWTLSGKRPESSPAQNLVERINGREALLAWVRQTGFADMMNASLSGRGAPRALGGHQGQGLPAPRKRGLRSHEPRRRWDHVCFRGHGLLAVSLKGSADADIDVTSQQL